MDNEIFAQAIGCLSRISDRGDRAMALKFAQKISLLTNSADHVAVLEAAAYCAQSTEEIQAFAELLKKKGHDV